MSKFNKKHLVDSFNKTSELIDKIGHKIDTYYTNLLELVGVDVEGLQFDRSVDDYSYFPEAAPVLVVSISHDLSQSKEYDWYSKDKILNQVFDELGVGIIMFTESKHKVMNYTTVSFDHTYQGSKPLRGGISIKMCLNEQFTTDDFITSLDELLSRDSLKRTYENIPK